MQQAVYECQHQHLFSTKERGNMLSSLLIHFLRSTSNVVSQPSAETADTEVKVQRFVDSLQARCHEPWTLQSMAAACELERTQFSTYVLRVSGLSPKQLLNHLRIKRACELLMFSKDAITHIALDCGFDSSQYFARVFKQHMGMDARSYRSLHV
jgi:AraC family L-rhamnose operon regulatory protein RhaS